MIYTEVKITRKICESLRENTINIINLKIKKLLTNEQQELYKKAKIFYICKEKLENKYIIDKKYCKDREYCNYAGEYRGAAHSICNLKYCVPKKIPVAFHNGSYYNYHFITKNQQKRLKESLII